MKPKSAGDDYDPENAAEVQDDDLYVDDDLQCTKKQKTLPNIVVPH